MMNPRRTLSFSTILCLAAPLFAQGEVDLRTTAKKGSSVWLSQVQKQEQNMDMGGQEVETSQTTTRVVQVTVKDVDDKGNLIVETKIARVHGSITMPMGMGDVDFDSATPEAKEKADDEGMAGMGAMMTKALMAGAGKQYTAKVSPFGKVVELMADAAEIVKSNAGGMMGGGGIDEGTLKQIVESAFGTLPEKATAVGSKWEHKQTEGKNRMPVEHKMELTLAKADADSFEITAVGTVQKPTKAADEKGEKGEKEGDEAAMASEMMKSMKIKSGKVAGTQRVSRKDGFVIEATNSVAMDVEMTAGPMGEMQMAVKMTMSTKRTTSDAATAAKKEEKKEKDEKKDEKKEPKKDEKKDAGK